MPKAKPEKAAPPKVELKTLIVSALVILLIFACILLVLVWSASAVKSQIALSLVFIVGIVLIMVSLVAVLAINGIVDSERLMAFYHEVLKKTPALTVLKKEPPKEKPAAKKK